MDGKRCGQVSKEQKRYLLQYLEEHPELQSGKFTQQFTFKRAQILWKELATILNSMPGSFKDWMKWRKTWHDMKNLTKSKGASIKRYKNGTGGGPPPKVEFTTEDEKIMSMISSVAVGGHEGVIESETLFVPDTNIEMEEIVDVTNIISDHSYNVHESNTEVGDNNGENVSCAIISETNQNMDPISISTGKKCNEKIGNKVPLKCTRGRRLENTLSATEKMASQMEQKLKIRENYCKKKLEIMNRDVEAKLRIAAALETIAICLERNYEFDIDNN